MSTTPIPIITDGTQIVPAESHRKAAKYLEAAAKHHQDAAHHHDEGNLAKAHEASIKAQGNQNLATEATAEISKHYVNKN